MVIPSMALVLAIMMVESGGNLEAVGQDGKSFGPMQITDICRNDINRIYGTRFKRRDCFNLAMSQWMFRLYINHYASAKRLGREPNDRDRARIWNGGPDGYKELATAPYWEKVRKVMAQNY